MTGQADAEFQAQAGIKLAALPGVQAVTLGGSRAAGYARTGHAPRGHLADTAGAIATAACQAAHAVLAERGEWITNEKTLLDRAGLRGVDAVLAGLTAEPAVLRRAVDQAEALLSER